MRFEPDRTPKGGKDRKGRGLLLNAGLQPNLTLLTLKSETADDGLNPFRGGLRQVLLLPDSLGPGQHRRLRAFLRMPG